MKCSQEVFADKIQSNVNIGCSRVGTEGREKGAHTQHDADSGVSTSVFNFRFLGVSGFQVWLWLVVTGSYIHFSNQMKNSIFDCFRDVFEPRLISLDGTLFLWGFSTFSNGLSFRKRTL